MTKVINTAKEHEKMNELPYQIISVVCSDS